MAAACVIGVAAPPDDLAIAAEFFELFKTPWEPVARGRRYPVVVCSESSIDGLDAAVILLFGSQAHAVDTAAGMTVQRLTGTVEVVSNKDRFPVYRGVAQFDGCGQTDGLVAAEKPVEYRMVSGSRTVVRIGYDILAETQHLLREGQPVAHAATPTLEHHISVVRRLLVTAGVAFIEIAPTPAGFDYVCCLTHDLDFFGIRRHGADLTLAGFLFRASVGTLGDLLRGRRPVGEAMRNWLAFCSLPLVFMRLLPDFWRPFDDYAEAERGLPSTFFLVPVKGRPGIDPDGAVHAQRAVPYQISDIAEEIGHAAARGSEMAVHGVDAWRTAEAGREEIAELKGVTGQTRAGVRMHWLYFDDRSAKEIELAGFDYDSTYAYNDAVGYRAGTSQVFQVPGTGLMELPLSIMDSALFFEGRMALHRTEALRRCRSILDNARRFGGTVVINWHDRSLSPERQWQQPYAELLDDLRTGNRAWFSTASQAVDWFRWRRSIQFRSDVSGNVTVCAPARDVSLPPTCVRVHRSGPAPDDSIEEHAYDGHAPLTLQL